MWINKGSILKSFVAVNFFFQFIFFPFETPEKRNVDYDGK